MIVFTYSSAPNVRNRENAENGMNRGSDFRQSQNLKSEPFRPVFRRCLKSDLFGNGTHFIAPKSEHVPISASYCLLILFISKSPKLSTFSFFKLVGFIFFFRCTNIVTKWIESPTIKKRWAQIWQTPRRHQTSRIYQDLASLVRFGRVLLTLELQLTLVLSQEDNKIESIRLSL